jgi:hypothetical protein
MPIHVYININKDLINQLHIGRIKGGTDPDDINTYLVVDGEYPTRLEDWHIDGIPFEHRYGDGAEICVMKAMRALYGKID